MIARTAPQGYPRGLPPSIALYRVVLSPTLRFKQFSRAKVA